MKIAINLKDVGKRIREARRVKDWSQQLLADKAGIERPSLSNIERGKNQPTTKVVESIAEALGTNICAFLKKDFDFNLLRKDNYND